MIGLFLLILDFGGWNLHALKKKKKKNLFSLEKYFSFFHSFIQSFSTSVLPHPISPFNTPPPL